VTIFIHNNLLTVNNKMCQTGSRKCVADIIEIDQLHYLNAECPFWVLYYISMVPTLLLTKNPRLSKTPWIIF